MAERKRISKPAIWDPDKALEGVFCPTCDTWMDDYYGQPEKCPACGQELSGWIDGSEAWKGKNTWDDTQDLNKLSRLRLRSESMATTHKYRTYYAQDMKEKEGK